MSRTRIAVAMFISVFAVLNVGAKTYYVNASRSDDTGVGTSWGTAKKTIQAAINVSVAGDAIIVTNGLYAPISTYRNKAITIESVNGAGVTLIDGGSTTRCATLGSDSMHTSTVLNGFTLQNGRSADSGGGSAYGTLNNCTLTGNTASYGGGSYYGTLNNCTLIGNTAENGYGGGSIGSTLNNCILSGNMAGSGGGSAYGTLNNCTLTGNTASYGGGFYGYYGGTLNNCTLTGNTASNGGGSYGGKLNNCIVWGNFASMSANNCYETTMQYSCSDPMQSGIGNISANPMFVDAANGNYQLSVGSPCINVGANRFVNSSVDLAGNSRIFDGTVDMGAYEFSGDLAVTITFNAQAGSPPSPASKSVTYASTYGTLATASRTGYTFAGWWTEAGGTGSEVTSSTIVTITSAQTLYAKWTASSYTVTFDAQGGAAPNPEFESVTFASAYGTLATTSRAGYTFAGWWTEVGGTGSEVTSATTVSIASAQTLYAKWTAKSYTVTFDAQSGTGLSPSSKIVPFASPYGTLATTSRTGYTFAGWWTEAGGTGSEVTSSTIVTITSAQTLYAKWDADAYTVVNGSDSEPIGTTDSVNFSVENSGDGGTSIRLGGIGLLADGEMAGLEWFVTGLGVLSFEWKVSSEQGYDVLSFYEVGIGATNQISGTGTDWTRISVEAGGDTNTVHTYRWEYEKDPIGDYVEDDCGWVDAITWTPKYALTVNSGIGDGWYTNGTSVAISADTPVQYYEFDKWTGNTNGIADVFAPSTTLVMPATNAKVTAIYKPIPLHELTVINGSGSGWHPEGSVVTVAADPDPLYMEFAEWTGDAAGLLNDASASPAFLTMPTRAANLIGTYRDSIARVSGSYGHTYTQAGTEGGISTDTGAVSPSGNAAVKLGGTGVVPDSGFVAFETVVTGSGSVTFWWKTASEVNDYLKFKVDGVQIAAISGTKTPWTFASNRVEGASVVHTLRWEYVKNASSSSSTDASWVDDIVWIGDVPVPALTPDISTTESVGPQFKFKFWGERGIPYTVYSNSTLGVSGWAPMDIAPVEIGETNGVFEYEATVVPPEDQPAGFYRVLGGDK